MKLTIAIPTWNRPEMVANTLRRLVPQLTSECFLLIIDNCSVQPVSEIALPLLKDVPASNYSIVRNAVNIGGNGNVMRCFEYCRTPWLWTLGDDDEITSDAIKTILEDIAVEPDATYINYYSPHEVRPVRPATLRNVGREQFIANTDSLGSLMYISCNVYNVPKVIKMFWAANGVTYSCAPQWLIVLFSANEQTITIFSHRVICHNPYVNPGNLDTGLYVARGWATLLDVNVSRKERLLIRTMLRRDVNQLVSVDGLIKALLIDHFASNRQTEIRYSFGRYYHTLYKYLNFSHRARWHLYNVALTLSPSLLFAIVRRLYIRKRGIDINQFITTR